MLLSSKPTVGQALRYWRENHKTSQLELALEANISARHLSFIETGRAKPSRDVLLSLALALKLPLKQQNSLLVSAGYLPEYHHHHLDDPAMAPVRQILQRLLSQHEPYPTLVVSPSYDILLANQGFYRTLAKFLGEAGSRRYQNVYRMFFDPNGLQPYIVDWPFISAFLLRRLRDEALVSHDSALQTLFAQLTGQTPLPHEAKSPKRAEPELPVLCLSLQKDGLRFNFISTITTFGTPLDVLAQELRIEALFPADPQTEALFQNQLLDENGGHLK